MHRGRHENISHVCVTHILNLDLPLQTAERRGWSAFSWFIIDKFTPITKIILQKKHKKINWIQNSNVVWHEGIIVFLQI